MEVYIYILYVYIELSPCPVTVTTRVIVFLIGDPYKPSFATVTWRGGIKVTVLLVAAAAGWWI